VQLSSDLAFVYGKNGDFTKALAVAKTIPSANRPPRLLPVIASASVFAGNQEQAHEAIGVVLQHAASNPEIVPALANSFLDRGRANDAAELLRIAQARQKVTPAFLAALARTHAAQGDQQAARRTFDEAIRLDPKSQEVLATGAQLANGWGQWDKALEFLDAALAAGPPRTDLLQAVVLAELRKPDLQAAHEVAQRWYELRPNETDGALAFAVVLVEGNHWGEAQPLLEKVLATAPNNKGALLAMGVVQYNAGDLQAAQRTLNASLGGPDDANARYFLGLIAKQAGDLPGARTQFEQSVAITPTNPKAYGQLGQLYFQQNDLSKARAALETAVAQAPKEPQNHYELARVYNKLNMKAEAEEQLKLYQQLRPQRPQVPVGEAPSQPH